MTSIEECSLAMYSIDSAPSEIDLAALVQTYSALLFRVAHSVLHSQTEAEDVIQDVFVRVLQHRRSLLAIEDMRVWLVRIAWNLALDRRRRVRPDQLDASFALSLVANTIPADQAIEESRRINAVLLEIERLPKGERHVLLLSAIDELSTAEMASVLGKSESAIRSLLFRARTRLRQRLEKGGHAI
jgi:RNA polymerase sigma-70 factor (ECF subfamily)